MRSIDAGSRIFILALVFAGCSDDPLGSLNMPPTAEAGNDVTVEVGETVEILGRGVDPDGDPLTFEWSLLAKPDGSQTALTSAYAPRISLQVDALGDYVLQLVVRDGEATSVPDPVVVTAVEEVPVTRPLDEAPVAVAGADQAVEIGQIAQLNGSRSYDPEGAPITYRWTFTTAPGGSVPSLSDARSVAPSFLARHEGMYRLELVVNDGAQDSAPDPVVILAGVSNTRPIAVAGVDQTVDVGELVTLDGSASFDPDGDPIDYDWRLVATPANSGAALLDADTAHPTLRVDIEGTYRVELVVRDGILDSAADLVIITVQAPPPVGAKIVDLPASWLLSDPNRGVLYASVPSTSRMSGTGNSVVAIDPESGAITQSVFVGSEPGTMAMSDDGTYLYVALFGAYAIRRVALDTFVAEDQFAVPPSDWRDTRNAGRIVVLPGSPKSIAVSTHIFGLSPSFDGVVVLDDGVPRANRTRGHTGAARLVGGPSNTLFGFNNLHTGFEFYVLTVDASGVSVDSETRGLIDGFGTDIIYDDGLVIATSGQAVDPAGPALVGTYAATGPVAADPTRVYFLSGDTFDANLSLVAFDRSTFVAAGEESMNDLYGRTIEGGPYNLVRWGDDGLAFRTAGPWSDSAPGKVYIFRSSLVIP